MAREPAHQAAESELRLEGAIGAREGRLRAIVSHSRVGLWLVSTDDEADLGPDECSPELERFLGHSARELQRRGFAELLHAEDLHQDETLRAQLLAGERDSYELEARFLHKRGQVVWGHVGVSPVTAADGRISHLVYTIVDITRRKVAEQRLAHINETLRSYAHTVSHDLKGPLSGAVTASRVLRQLLEQPLGDQKRASALELVDLLTGGALRAIELIDELLRLAEAGPRPDGVAAVAVDAVLDRVLQEHGPTIAERGIRVARGEGLGQMPVAPAHAYQILANLVGNAIQHNPGRPLTITVERGAPSAAEPGAYRLIVRDDGRGIAAELQSRLFDPFVRGGGSGCGIGLSTVKRIVQAYGGEIRLKEPREGGAAFEVVVYDLGQ